MEEITNQTPQEQQPPINDESLEDIGRKRDFQIKQKRAFFNKVKLIAIILFVTSAGLLISYIITERQRTTAPTKPIVIDTPTPTNVQEPASTWELDRDDNLKVFVKVPPEAKLFTAQNPSTLSIVFSKNEPDFSKVDTSNLSDGYIFRITPLSVGTRDLNKLTEIKRESYKIQCPSTANITPAHGTKVDTIDSTYFEVFNCNVDYKISYVPRFGIYYEIAQIYRGDIGVGQQYKTQTEELLRAFRFFPEDSPRPYDPNASYFNDDYNFSIKYPTALDTTCCELLGPAGGNNITETKAIQKLLVGAYLPTFKDKNNFDGVAFYLVTYGNQQKIKTDFNTFVNEQKSKLVEDYKIVKGTLPTIADEDIKVGQYTGKLLKGYHWQGSNLIFLDVSASRKTAFFVIVTRNNSGEEFQKIIDGILQSYEFFPQFNTK